MSPCKILVVDDFEPLRRFVCSVFEHRAEFQIVGQAADGLEAVQKAEEFQPDLIVLDISLPKLSGIEAAREIRKVAPNSKILFLSEHTSPEIIEAALSTGAKGYVVKSEAGSELLGAVEAVIEGGLVSSRRLEDADRLAARPEESDITHLHEVQFYSDEAGFLGSFTSFIATVLKAGNRVILVATESHRNALLSKLQSDGLDIDSAIERGNYIALDVVETLSTFMVGDLPDPVQFSKVVGDLMARATSFADGERLRVAACGECAPFLWAQGKAEAAVRLEQLWSETAKTYGVDILCGYPLMDFHGNQGRDMFEKICDEHTAVYSR